MNEKRVIKVIKVLYVFDQYQAISLSDFKAETKYLKSSFIEDLNMSKLYEIYHAFLDNEQCHQSLSVVRYQSGNQGSYPITDIKFKDFLRTFMDLI